MDLLEDANEELYDWYNDLYDLSKDGTLDLIRRDLIGEEAYIREQRESGMAALSAFLNSPSEEEPQPKFEVRNG
ncbi:MAG: hypothetical protein HUU10_04520 [Bacteroidetes bacterium]|nr:hypothetical protein [Bacteroidota bacterium]